jgi:hypothetical protein
MALIDNPYSLGFCILLASLRKAANPAVPSGPDIYLAWDVIRPALSADYCCGCPIDLTYDHLMVSKYGKLPGQIDSLLVGSRRKQPTDFNQSKPIQGFTRRAYCR